MTSNPKSSKQSQETGCDQTQNKSFANLMITLRPRWTICYLFFVLVWKKNNVFHHKINWASAVCCSLIRHYLLLALNSTAVDLSEHQLRQNADIWCSGSENQFIFLTVVMNDDGFALRLFHNGHLKQKRLTKTVRNIILQRLLTCFQAHFKHRLS